MFGKKWKEVQTNLARVHDEISTLRAELKHRDAQLSDVQRGLQALEGRLSDVDSRVTHMTTAITNQLHELDAEIEKLAETADAASAEAVNELRVNQVRIASEQARYAITLRQDLAELAELLRKSRG